MYWKVTGRIPGPGECIHHKNDKKRDNRFENLELKKRSKHTKEHNLDRGRKFVELMCPSCHCSFERERRQTHLAKSGKRTFCSKSCGGRGSVGIVENVVREFVKYKCEPLDAALD